MILYFTGTGNSKYVANRIAAALNDEAINLFDKIKNEDYSPMTSDSPWIIVTPTYAWQIPNIAKNWLNKVALNGNKSIFFVLTCGDSIGNAATFAKNYAKAKNMKFKGLTKVVMPENYIAMFNVPNEAEAKDIIEKSNAEIDLIASAIKSGRNFITETSFLGALQSGPINKIFYSAFVKDKKFTVSPNCNGCGICKNGCITNNITIKNGKPLWNGNCTHCMACICNCPKEAIEYGTKSIGQPRYKCPAKI